MHSNFSMSLETSKYDNSLSIVIDSNGIEMIHFEIRRFLVNRILNIHHHK